MTFGTVRSVRATSRCLLAAARHSASMQTADRVAEMTAVLDGHLAALRDRDVAERQYVTATVQAVVERLLAEPRGRLRKLRDDTAKDER